MLGAGAAARQPDDLRRVSALNLHARITGTDMTPMIELTLRVANSIGAVAAEAWDACANPVSPPAGNGAGAPNAPCATSAETSETGYNPFISHSFLSAPEQSQSVRARPG